MQETKLERLQRERKELCKKVEKKNQEIYIEICRLTADDHGLVHRKTILLSNGSEYLFDMITDSSPLIPFVKAFPKEKDGSWSKLPRHLYANWEVKCQP